LRGAADDVPGLLPVSQKRIDLGMAQSAIAEIGFPTVEECPLRDLSAGFRF